MDTKDYQGVPKELIGEMLFMLGMQAQSLRMSVAGGIGGLAGLDEAIRRNNEDKEALISLLYPYESPPQCDGMYNRLTHSTTS